MKRGRANTLALTHSNILTHRHTHTRLHSHTLTHTLRHIYTDTHTHTHSCTDTHTVTSRLYNCTFIVHILYREGSMSVSVLYCSASVHLPWYSHSRCTEECAVRKLRRCLCRPDFKIRGVMLSSCSADLVYPTRFARRMWPKYCICRITPVFVHILPMKDWQLCPLIAAYCNV